MLQSEEITLYYYYTSAYYIPVVLICVIVFIGAGDDYGEDSIVHLVAAHGI